MPSTDIAYGAIYLGACCAMHGTDIAYGATRLHRRATVDLVPMRISLRLCYEMRGTDMAYVATRMCGTDIEYGVTRTCGTDVAYMVPPEHISLHFLLSVGSLSRKCPPASDGYRPTSIPYHHTRYTSTISLYSISVPTNTIVPLSYAYPLSSYAPTRPYPVLTYNCFCTRATQTAMVLCAQPMVLGID
eukprot:3738049-Rhodomonas_salina.1